jgi:7-alpha-hydroxysteroid dehydrogenase
MLATLPSLSKVNTSITSIRVGQPEDIAAAVAFLASEDGAWVNGQVWHVNGGMIKRD